MVRIRRDAEGKYFYDFSVLKRYIQLCEKYAIDGDITVYGLMGIWKICRSSTALPSRIIPKTC